VSLERAIDEPLRIRFVRVACDHRVLTWKGLVLIGAALLLSPRLRPLATRLAGPGRDVSLDRESPLASARPRCGR
jgi:hypothetical protein